MRKFNFPAWAYAGIFILGLLFIGCNGSSSSSDDDDETLGDTIALTGTVKAPSAGTANLSSPLLRSSLKRAVDATDTAVANATVTIYTAVDGEECGTGTTADDGTVTVNVDETILRGDDDTGDTYTEGVVLVAHVGEDADGDGEGDTEIGVYADVTVTADTTTVALPDADSAATLALNGMAGSIPNFAGWGVAYGTALAGIDLGCLFVAQKAVWENSIGAEDEGGLWDDQAIIADTMRAYWAGGGTPMDLGYSNFGDMMQAVMQGEAGEVWDDIVTTAATVDDTLDVESVTAAYDSAAAAFSAFDDVLATNLGGFSGTTEAGALRKRAVDATEMSEACASMKDGTVDPCSFVCPMGEAEDLETFLEIYDSDDGFGVHFGLFQNCMEQGNCADMIDNKTAFYGFMKGYGGDFSGAYSGGVLDTTTIGGIWQMAGACATTAALEVTSIGAVRQEAETDSETKEQMMNCAYAMYGTVYSGGDGWEGFMEGGEFSEDRFNTMGSYWITEFEMGFDPNELGNTTFYANAWDTMGGIFDSEGGEGDELKTCVDTAMEAGTDPAACFAGVQHFNEFVETGTQISSYCGNGACDEAETEENCRFDCGDVGAFFGGGGGYCGDGTCNSGVGETTTFCPADCTSQSGGGGSTCGNGTCESGESAASCPADCTTGSGGGTQPPDFAGTYIITSVTGCSTTLGQTRTFEGVYPTYNRVGGADVEAFEIGQNNSCTYTRNSTACEVCSYTGSGEAGSTVTRGCGTCTQTLTKQ